MAFDKTTRNRLSTFVSEARKLIAEEFTLQLQSLYGISVKGTITPLEQLNHIDDAGLATAVLLRERIDYLVKTHSDGRDNTTIAVGHLVREQAFTIINRLAAVRMAEKRGIIIESVGNGYQSRGFKVYEQMAGSGLGDTYNRYRRYIFCLFDELAVDLGALFDRQSPQGLLFPRQTALQGIFALLNAPDLDLLWAEDETIGWIYQYYNDPAERKRMRDDSIAPRNSRELAVRNQFFTPRYVVEFLTDNALGRIWYEMMKGETRLTSQCRYLVRRPTEIFLNPGETAPEISPPEDLSQEVLLKQTIYIPHRPIKDPREIYLLDPACGSMHFGLYAFDLFETIYEEAWDIGLDALRSDYPEKEILICEVPRLIIEHNIHGIDIDPRAVQIAGLSLWLRAQKNWRAQDIPVAQRPRILRSNVVCAEPMPGDSELLKEFSATLQPPLLGQMVEKVFTQMQLAADAGSLLKIEEDIATLIQVAKKLWQTGPKAEQIELNLGLEVKPKQGSLPLDVSGISDERFWVTAEDRIYAALHAYAEQADSGGYQRRLFAEDAEQGFAFIDLCRKKYDVVLMNPPFGEFSLIARDYGDQFYPLAYRELYAAFICRALSMTSLDAYVSAITSRTGFFIKSLNEWRTQVIVPAKVKVFADLGEGVLDSAVVETAAYVLGSTRKPLENKLLESLFIRLPANPEDKENALAEELASVQSGCAAMSTVVNPNAFLTIPDCPFAYWLPRDLMSCFSKFERIEGKKCTIKVGLQTGDDYRFIRTAWEVPPSGIRSSSRHDEYWVFHAKGGDNAPFWTDIHLVVKWHNGGDEIKAHKSSTIRNKQFYLKPGLTFPYRVFRFSPAALPAGCITGVAGMGIFPLSISTSGLLAALNTDIVNKLVSVWLGRMEMGSLYQAGTIQAVPFPRLNPDTLKKLSDIGTQQVLLRIALDSSDETTRYFVGFQSIYGQNLEEITELKSQQITLFKSKSLELFKASNSILFREYELKETSQNFIETHHKDEAKFDFTLAKYTVLQKAIAEAICSYFVGIAFGRWDVRFANSDRSASGLSDPFAPLPVCPPGMLQNLNCLPAEPNDVPADYPLPISWSGILVDDQNHPEDIVARVREVIELIWRERADSIEYEICEFLGVKTLRDYFTRSAGFFNDHLKRYSKSRRQAPIYWPLTTNKGSYTLWIYYHRLTDQTLHTALADYIDPKLRSVRAEISVLHEAGSYRNRLEELQELERELIDFSTEIERIIKLPWNPDLNDGVSITASPLWKLFRLPKWQKDLKDYWEKLEKGEYDWAHLAYSIWPKRVEEACKIDRSIAIAHNLEHLYQAPPAKATRGKRKKANVFEES